MLSNCKKHFNYPFFVVFGLLAIWSCSKDSTTTPGYDAVKQAKIDDSLWVEYFNNRGLTDSVTKTASGLYYRILKACPDSAKVDSGRFAFVRYEGRTTNDTIFDTNLFSSRAFTFEVGAGTVIKGWDEGIPKFRKGEEGFLYIPSVLAYRNQAQTKIPANSNLKFFIRITNIE